MNATLRCFIRPDFFAKITLIVQMGRQIVQVSRREVRPLATIESSSWMDYLHQLLQRPLESWQGLIMHLEPRIEHAMYDSQARSLCVFTNGQHRQLHTTQYWLKDVLFQLLSSVDTLYWLPGVTV